VDTFKAGQMAWSLTGPWNVKVLEDAGRDIQVCKVPTWSDGQDSQPIVGVQAFILSAFSKGNRHIAETFVNDYVASEVFQDAMHEADPRPPALTASPNKVTTDPMVKGFVEYGKQGIPQPNIVEMTAVWTDWASLGRTSFAARTRRTR